MNELERYGVIPGRWWFEETEEGYELILTTDIGTITLSLSNAQAAHLKDKMDFYRRHVGREWKNGMLLIPAKGHEEK